MSVVDQEKDVLVTREHECPYETFARRGGAGLSAVLVEQLVALHRGGECPPATTDEGGYPEPTRAWDEWVRDHRS